MKGKGQFGNRTRVNQNIQNSLLSFCNVARAHQPTMAKLSARLLLYCTRSRCHMRVAARWWQRLAKRKPKCGHMSLTFSPFFSERFSMCMISLSHFWFFGLPFSSPMRFNRQTSQPQRRRQYDNFPLIYIFNWTLWPHRDSRRARRCR